MAEYRLVRVIIETEGGGHRVCSIPCELSSEEESAVAFRFQLLEIDGDLSVRVFREEGENVVDVTEYELPE